MERQRTGSFYRVLSAWVSGKRISGTDFVEGRAVVFRAVAYEWEETGTDRLLWSVLLFSCAGFGDDSAFRRSDAALCSGYSVGRAAV